MDEPPALNPLSCKRCKERKTRCSRVIPQCDRCKDLDVECVYPARVKRRQPQPPAGRPTASNVDLAAVLDRLQHLEDSISHPSPHQTSSSYTPTNAGSLPSFDHSIRHAFSPISSDRTRPAIWSPPEPVSVSGLDVTSTLKDAVDQVQKIRLRGIAHDTVSEEVSIPPVLAKRWIQSYFSRAPSGMFVDVLPRELIESMPDIIGLPYVHIDAAVHVIYYCILYQGVWLPASNLPHRDAHRYMRKLYICCLRSLPAWRREATGSLPDFMAAIFMSRVSAEFFDLDIFWQVTRLAGEYSMTLNLHNLDSPDAPNPVAERISGGDRKGLWELMEIDLFFRLLFDRPPNLPVDIEGWKVNLPWLSAGPEARVDAESTVCYLVDSRTTFVMARFFKLLEGSRVLGSSKLLEETEALCLEIEKAFQEWNLHEWFRKVAGRDVLTYIMTDVLLTGNTCIMFMLRKLAVPPSAPYSPVSTDADLPASPVALRAARRFLQVAETAMSKYPSPHIMCVIFGTYQGYVACACVASTVMRGEGDGGVEDVELLEGVTAAAAGISREEAGFEPLVVALREICVGLRKRLGARGRAFENV